MTDLDYAQNWDFIDPADGKRRKMRFRFHELHYPLPRIADYEGTGQLIAVAENGDEIAISRPDVQRGDMEAAIAGWENWASHYASPRKRVVDLALIRDRLRAAGLT